jgi:serine/threonine protein kinase
VTDVFTGGDLLEAVSYEGKFSEEKSAKCIRSLLEALNYLHDKNLMHRDVKLENILVSTNSDNEPPVVLTDLGLVCFCD